MGSALHLPVALRLVRRTIHVSSVSACLLVACLGACAVSAQEKPLDNADIVKLMKLDLGDDVIVAKVKAAAQVSFDTSTEGLSELKSAGVSKTVLAAMLERQARDQARTAPASSPSPTRAIEVTLQARSGPVALKPVQGFVKTQAAPFSVVQWVQFPDLSAKVRTTDPRPAILLAWDRDPRGAWWFVRLSEYNHDDEVYRYFDLEGGGGFSAVWSGAPEKGSIIKVEVAEDQQGWWRLTPLRDLKPGEYGLFSGTASTPPPLSGGGRSTLDALLFDFGIDK